VVTAEPEEEDDELVIEDEPEPEPLFEFEPEPEPVIAPVTAPPPDDDGSNGGLPDQDGGVNVEGTNDAYAWIDDLDVPRVTIGGREVVLYAPLGAPAWALVNLILCILGAVLAIIYALRALFREKGGKKGKDKGGASSGRDSGGYVTSLDDNDEEFASSNTSSKPAEKRKRDRLVWLIVAGVLAFLGIILFILTEDMRAPMVLVDIWTILQAILFAGVVVAVLLIVRTAMETVIFEPNGGSNRFKQKVRSGEAIKLPKTPVRQGHAFAGWYSDEKFSNKWNFSEAISRSLTLYGKWNRVPKQQRAQFAK